MLVTPAIAGEFSVDPIAGSRSAHGGNKVGEVTVSDSALANPDGISADVTLTIKFSAEDPWLLAETHLAVAESLEEIPPLALMTWSGVSIAHRDAAFSYLDISFCLALRRSSPKGPMRRLESLWRTTCALSSNSRSEI